MGFIVRLLCNQLRESALILDLGCVTGDSIDIFEKLTPTAKWHGVDIEDSPEVKKRTRKHDSFKTFDGVNLPYRKNYFDLIYCNQVLEHVRYPDKLIAESFRILKPNGIFIGTVSYLEPFHSRSIFNFTPYGIVRVFSDIGFQIQEIRPESDASLLITRQLLNRSNMFRIIWNKNYLYIICNLISTVFHLENRERNFLKIQFAGHLIFLAKRPLNTEIKDKHI